MIDVQKDFAPFEGKIWLNAASEGPLPLPSARALVDAVEWKSKPYLLDIPKFVSTQTGLKDSLGKLIGASPRDMILGNSASYGLHLLADGFPWEQGDEVIVMHNDFPTDILPWLALEDIGVHVIQAKPENRVLSPDELAGVITDKTRLVCLPHVHTFSGIILDIPPMVAMCQAKGISFILNITQSVGTMPVDIKDLGVDAVVAAGYKWLCGPYGVGFCWMKPELREQLTVNRAYWPAVLTDDELQAEMALSVKKNTTARKLDMFGTANFFNFVPFKASIDYWLNLGIDQVRQHHDTLIDTFNSKVNRDKYDLISPREGSNRSSLIYFTHKEFEKNKQINKLLMGADIYTAIWKGNIRLAPHVYNTQEQIVKTVEFLDQLS